LKELPLPRAGCLSQELAARGLRLCGAALRWRALRYCVAFPAVLR